MKLRFFVLMEIRLLVNHLKTNKGYVQVYIVKQRTFNLKDSTGQEYLLLINSYY